MTLCNIFVISLIGLCIGLCGFALWQDRKYQQLRNYLFKLERDLYFENED